MTQYSHVMYERYHVICCIVT